jgi:alanyl-tRNA synthetase
MLKVTPEQAPRRIADVLGRLKDLERAAAKDQSRSSENQASDLIDKGKLVTAGNAVFLLAQVQTDGLKTLRDLADVIMNKKKDLGGVALVAVAGGKAQLVVKIKKALSATLNARDLATAGGKVLGGGGGGRGDMAVAGGPNIEDTADALLKVERAITETLEGAS